MTQDHKPSPRRRRRFHHPGSVQQVLLSSPTPVSPHLDTHTHTHTVSFSQFLLFFLKVSRCCRSITHAAALSAGLWLGIPVVVTNPRFLVAPSSRSCVLAALFPPPPPPHSLFLIGFLFLLLKGRRRSTEEQAPHRSVFSVMASNSIFDSFSNYSSSLLRGEC